MVFPAISIGYAVPDGDFHVSVHSVFRSAVNLRLDKTGHLLTLVVSGEGDLPQGIRLEVQDGSPFEMLQTGDPAVCRDGRLYFEGGAFLVQLRGARRWQCDLPALGVEISDPAVSAAWRLVRDTLNRRQDRSRNEMVVEGLFTSNRSARAGMSRRISEAMRALVNATHHYELADLSAVTSLIGLGPGLTPTGDDLLVGYMAGLWCMVRGRSERVKFVSGLGEAVIHASVKTTDISRTYLYHASQGQVSSRLAGLAEAICVGANRGDLLGASEKAIQAGHTSGMETVMGLLTGLAAWDGERLLPG